MVLNHLIEQNQLSETDIVGLLTINSPVGGSVSENFDEWKTREPTSFILTFNQIVILTISKSRKPEGIMILDFQCILDDLRGEYNE